MKRGGVAHWTPPASCYFKKQSSSPFNPIFSNSYSYKT